MWAMYVNTEHAPGIKHERRKTFSVSYTTGRYSALLSDENSLFTAGGMGKFLFIPGTLMCGLSIYIDAFRSRTFASYDKIYVSIAIFVKR